MSNCLRSFSSKMFPLLAGSMVLFVLWGLSGCGDLSRQSNELDLDAEKSPYEISCIRSIQRPVGQGVNETILMCDIDGDGIQECVEGTCQKFLGYDSEDARIKPRWEIHLDDDHRLSPASAQLGVSADLNGDGIEEIYFAAVSMDNSGWNYCVLDPAREEIVVNVPLPVGEDRRRPDYWDGQYAADGILLDADGQGNPGVVFTRIAKYDGTLRGVCVVEPVTGKIIWEYVGAAQPANDQTIVTDIDGDGSREIIFPTSAPGNWGDVRINGTRDIENYLIVLSNHGDVLMRVLLGGERFGAHLVVQDLDGDGIKELVTATENGRTNELVVWDWKTKKSRKKIRSSANFQGLAVTEGPHAGSSHIFTGTDDGAFHRYLFDGESLKRERMIMHSSRHCRLVGAVDILPLPGLEIMVRLEDIGKTVVLDQDFSTKGVYSSDPGYGNYNPVIWELSGGNKALVMSDAYAYWVLVMEKKPFDWAGKVLPAGGSLLVLVILLGTFYFGMVTGRKNRKAESAMAAEVAQSADIDALFRLQQELEDANHTVVGRTKGLERMVWLLDAYITDQGANEELGQRIRQVMADYQEEVKPRLFRLLRLAEQASFETGTVADVTKALIDISSRIDELSEKNMNIDLVRSMRADLQSNWKCIKEGFFLIRAASNAYFTIDPVRLIQGMLLVREGDFQRDKINTTLIGGSEKAGAMNCRIDNGDLRFVIDNLLDNAQRAMKDSTNRHLTVEISRTNKEIGLRVTDTGQGVAKDQQDAIFSSRFSSRRGGGRGLHRSREILARWGSEILMTDSQPGKGTTFVVKLLAASEEPGQKSMKARA